MSKGALTFGSIAWSEAEFSYSPVFYSHLYFVGQNHVGLVIMVIKAAPIFGFRERQRWTKQKSR